MIKFNYKDVAKEQGWSFDAINPLVEDASGYFYYKEVVKQIEPTTVMLDIGCGSGEKAVRYYSNAEKVIMIDNEPEMLKRAESNLHKCLTENESKHFQIQLGDGDGKLDFPDDYFDLVVSRHCGANMSEVFRVLKRGGVFISEDIDENDCLSLKKYYGRGQGWNSIINNTLLKKEIFNQCLDLGFSDINLKNFEFTEYYVSKEQLKYLLTRTPILEYFDEDNDEKILDQYILDHSTSKGIELLRKLYAFYLVK